MNRRAIIILVSFAAAMVTAFPQVASAHWVGTDHSTGSSPRTWQLASNVPAGWTDGAVNGALVWDNVTAQCHDWQRVTNGSPALWFYGDSVVDPLLGASNAGHTAITLTKSVTWHLNVSTTPGGSSYDLWSVAAHEFGHQTGLDPESTNSADTMYYQMGPGEWGFRTLSSNDIARERALYGC